MLEIYGHIMAFLVLGSMLCIFIDYFKPFSYFFIKWCYRICVFASILHLEFGIIFILLCLAYREAYKNNKEFPDERI